MIYYYWADLQEKLRFLLFYGSLKFWAL